MTEFKTVVNVETGQQTEVELTQEEKNEQAANLLLSEAQAAEEAAKAEQKAALLERLGITAEEAQLLLGGN
jgi:hypothetical protein